MYAAGLHSQGSLDFQIALVQVHKVFCNGREKTSLGVSLILVVGNMCNVTQGIKLQKESNELFYIVSYY